MKHCSFQLLIICILFCQSVTLFTSCKPGIPRDYIQPSDMEDILYDYHVAQAMANQNTLERGIDQRSFRLAVFKKHDVTEAEFDSSMVYYIRHTDELHTIYENLSKRFDDASKLLGGNGSIASLSVDGDTANVWTGSKSLMLVTQDAFNQYSYSFKTDSTFHKGDVLILNFDSHFIFQDGMRDAIAVMTVRFANDSVSSQVLHVSASQTMALQINDDKKLGLKEVRGFFMLNKPNDPNQSQTTLQLLSLSNIKLIRLHERDEKKPIGTDKDSINIDSVDHTQPSQQPINPSPSSQDEVVQPSRNNNPSMQSQPVLPVRHSGNMPTRKDIQAAPAPKRFVRTQN